MKTPEQQQYPIVVQVFRLATESKPSPRIIPDTAQNMKTSPENFFPQIWPSTQKITDFFTCNK